MKFRLHLKSFLIFLLIFMVEVLIALFVRDKFVRPYGGDILVVIMIYYFLKSFIETKPINLVVGTLLFAYLVEIGQYFKMVEVLGVHENKLMTIILGSSFSWGDMVCYTVGAAICLLIDRRGAKSCTE